MVGVAAGLVSTHDNLLVPASAGAVAVLPAVAVAGLVAVVVSVLLVVAVAVLEALAVAVLVATALATVAVVVLHAAVAVAVLAGLAAAGFLAAVAASDVQAAAFLAAVVVAEDVVDTYPDFVLSSVQTNPGVSPRLGFGVRFLLVVQVARQVAKPAKVGFAFFFVVADTEN